MTRVGIVVALAAEAAALHGRRQRPGTITEPEAGQLVHLCGIGGARARAAAAALLDGGAGALVSWGIAGGLGPECRAGDLLLPEAVRTPAGERVGCDGAWRARLRALLGARVRVLVGEQLACDRIVDAPAEKRRLATLGVLGVDMESGGIAETARTAGVPLVAIRAVADPQDLRVPHCAFAGVAADGRARPVAALGALCRRPRELGALLRLWRAHALALRTLRLVRQLAGARLCSPDDS